MVYINVYKSQTLCIFAQALTISDTFTILETFTVCDLQKVGQDQVVRLWSMTLFDGKYQNLQI